MNNNQYWKPIDKNGRPSEPRNEFIKMLEKSNISNEIATEVANQIQQVEEDSNIIFIFSDDNEYVVTGIHVPAESINGQDGPVLMRGSTDKSIIAAFSRDFIISKLEKLDSKELASGLPGIADVQWVDELENLAKMVRLELAMNPPEQWDDLLKGEQE